MKEMIVAMGLDGAIGKDNKLLWNLKDDMKHFVEKTKGKNVVMGRKTFESLPNGPLKNRKNYVLTKNPTIDIEMIKNTYVEYLTYDEFIAKDIDYIVIGGAEIYELFKSDVDIMYITLVCSTFPDADAHFDSINAAEWTPLNPKFYPINEENDYPFQIVEMKRR